MARGRGRGRGRVSGTASGAELRSRAGAGFGGEGGGRRRGRGRGRGRGKGGGDSVGKFLGPHTGRQAGAIANAQAGAEYNPEINDLRSEAKGSRKREQDLGSWYAQLAADYQGAQDQGAAALQAVADTTSKQLAEAGARSSADQASLAAADEAFAKLVGGPKDTAGLAQIAQAGQAAAAARVDQAKLPLSEQANFTSRLGSDKTAARMQGIEERRAEQRRRDKIKADLVNVRKDKGRARVGKKEEIRQADRGYTLDKKQLKLSQQEARAAEQQAAADAALAQIEASREARQDAIGNRMEQERIGISRKNARTSARAQRETARNNREDNKGGLTPTQRRAAKREQKSATITAANLYKAAKRPPKTESQWAAFVQLVAAEEGIDPTAAQKAVAKLREAQAAKRRRGYSERARRGEVAGPPAPRGR